MSQSNRVVTHTKLLALIGPSADSACGGEECTVGLHQPLRGNTCHLNACEHPTT